MSTLPCRRLEERSEDGLVKPSNGWHAHGVSEAVKHLILVAQERIVVCPLESRVFPWGHPTHSQLASIEHNHDLLGAATARGSQASGYPVESNLCSRLPVPLPAVDRADMRASLTNHFVNDSTVPIAHHVVVLRDGGLVPPILILVHVDQRRERLSALLWQREI